MRRIVLAVALVLLGACAPAEESVPPDDRVLIDVEEMDVSFLFHEPLTLRASQDEALLSGASTAIHVQTLPYGDSTPTAQNGEAPTWALPRGIAKEVLNERSCGPLKSERVYLPIDTMSPLRCDLVLDTAGRAVVWMVGVGRPYQDVTFLHSVLMVMEGDEYHVFSYVYPFPEADATAQWLTETFPQRHPNMSALRWPNKSFLLLTDEVHEALSKQINPSSDEVQAVMERLRELAFSVGPSRALRDQ